MSAVAAPVVTHNPYPGLRPFDEGDSLFFFGRDQHVDDFIRRLTEHQFVAAVGLSGSGKSSLVRAGLLPAIRAGRLSSAGSRWRFAVTRPGFDPVKALARALDHPRALGPDLQRLVTLESSTFGLINTARQGRSAEDNLLVVVDQFEEVFRSQQEKHLDPQRAAHFVNLLLAATEGFPTTWRIFVVVTMRSDYLGDCAQFLGLPEVLSRAQYLVPRMNREQIREAIEGPAALTNTEFSSELVQRLLADAADLPDQLPLLQHLLMRLWERRDRANEPSLITLEHYRHCDIQGFDQALNLHADDVLGRLPEEDRPAAKRIFQRLTEIGEGRRDRRCPTPISELSRVARVPRESVTRIVNHFRREECSFLTSPHMQQGDEWEVDVTHESLIRRWRQLTEWAEEEAESAYWYKRILELFQFAKGHPEPLRGAELRSALEKGAEWHADWAKRYGGGFEHVERFLALSEKQEEEERDRVEAERRRRTARLLWLLAVASLTAIVLAGLSFVAMRNAQRAATDRDRAEEATGKAQEATIAAEQQTKVAQDAKKQLEEALLTSEKNRKLAEQRRDETTRERRLSESYRLAGAAAAQSDTETSLLLTVETVKRFSPSFHYGALWGRLWEAIYGLQSPLAVWRQSSLIRNVWFPDDTTVITRGAGAGAETEVFSIDGKPLGKRSLPSNAVFSSDGRLAAASVERSVVRIWTLPSMAAFDIPAAVTPRAFAAAAPVLVTHSSKNEIQLWEIEDGKARESARFNNELYANNVAISGDGRFVATRSTSGNGPVRLWERGTENPIASGDLPDFLAFLFLQDGTLGVIAQATLYTISAKPSKPRPMGMLPTAWIVSEDGVHLAIRNADQVRIVLPAERQLPDSANASAFVFSKDGKTLATVARDKGLQLWDANSGVQLVRGPHPNAVNVTFNRDGNLLATTSSDGEVRIWRREADAGMLKMPNSTFSGAAFSPDGRQIAIISESANQLDVVPLDGKGDTVSLPHDASIRVASFTRDGRTLVTATSAATLIWDWQRRQILDTVKQSAGSVSLTNDRRLLASNSGGTVVVRDLENGHETKFRHNTKVIVVAFSPAGLHLLTVASDGLRLWDLRNPEEPVRTFRSSEGTTEGTFSIDGRWLAVGTRERRVYVHDAATLSRVTEFVVPGLRFVGLDFASDHLMAAVELSGAQVRVLRYPLSWERTIEEVCGRLTRNLTPNEWSSFFPESSPQKTCSDLPDPK